jgi:hypothetical protein
LGLATRRVFDHFYLHFAVVRNVYCFIEPVENQEGRIASRCRTYIELDILIRNVPVCGSKIRQSRTSLWLKIIVLSVICILGFVTTYELSVGSDLRNRELETKPDSFWPTNAKVVNERDVSIKKVINSARGITGAAVFVEDLVCFNSDTSSSPRLNRWNSLVAPGIVNRSFGKFIHEPYCKIDLGNNPYRTAAVFYVEDGSNRFSYPYLSGIEIQIRQGQKSSLALDEGPYLEATTNSQNDGEGSYPTRGASCPASRPILRGFIFLLGFALVKLALQIIDQPTNGYGTIFLALFAWFLAIIALVQAVSLFVLGGWLNPL